VDRDGPAALGEERGHRQPGVAAAGDLRVPAARHHRGEWCIRRRRHRSTRPQACIRLIAGTSTGGILAAGLCVAAADGKTPKYAATELLDLEHARLGLRRFGFVLDRGRLVREAIAILLADLDARGTDSLVARRVRSINEAGTDRDAVENDGRDPDEDKGFSESAVPSLTWQRPLAAR